MRPTAVGYPEDHAQTILSHPRTVRTLFYQSRPQSFILGCLLPRHSPFTIHHHPSLYDPSYLKPSGCSSGIQLTIFAPTSFLPPRVFSLLSFSKYLRPTLTVTTATYTTASQPSLLRRRFHPSLRVVVRTAMVMSQSRFSTSLANPSPSASACAFAPAPALTISGSTRLKRAQRRRPFFVPLNVAGSAVPALSVPGSEPETEPGVQEPAAVKAQQGKRENMPVQVPIEGYHVPTPMSEPVIAPKVLGGVVFDVDGTLW